MASIFLKMEDDLKIFENGRRPNFFLKMTLIFLKKKDDLKKMMQPKTSKSTNNGCGTAPGNLVFHVL
jgi:hypothetical protein